MANKKISQLVGLGPYAGVSGEFYLPVGPDLAPYHTLLEKLPLQS